MEGIGKLISVKFGVSARQEMLRWQMPDKEWTRFLGTWSLSPRKSLLIGLKFVLIRMGTNRSGDVIAITISSHSSFPSSSSSSPSSLLTSISTYIC